MNFNYMLTHIRPLIADRSLKFPILKDGSGHYGDLFDAEVKRVLDIHVLLRTGRRCCGQHGSCHLLDEACQAKQQCRRLERWYRRTGLQSDKEVSLSACSTALQSRADHIKSELDESAGDVRATWRMAQRLLHSRHKVMYDDAQCAQLVSMFCQFLVDKVRRICDNISAALQSSVRRTFAVHQHLGPQLSSFEPVTAEEVRKLLFGMPSNSSPLDVLPCSLLKSFAHVLPPAIARLANLSLQTGKFPARYKRVQVLPLLKKAGSTVHIQRTISF